METTAPQIIPNNFRSLVKDFVNDLITVFPEYDFYLIKWGAPDISDVELKTLLDHCEQVYPERFFDILYKNEEIFQENSDINTHFLPRMNFQLLFNCEGVSDNSKESMWKYLQLMLFTVVGNIDDKKSFGDTMNIFEGIEEGMLQDKLEETMKGITESIEKMSSSVNGFVDQMDEVRKESELNVDGSNNEVPPSNIDEDMKNVFGNLPNMSGMPNLEGLHNNLKKLFDGKIGKLAKDLAEEVAEEFKDSLGDLDNANPQDVIKNLMGNPNKLKGIMKTVSSRLDDKMKSGEISREDIMKEAGDFLNEIKKTSGDAGVNEMLKNVMKNMGGIGKNAKINKGALNRVMKQSETKEKILKKAQERKNAILKKKEEEKQKVFERIREQNRLKQQFSLEQGMGEDNYVYKVDGEDSQEKSFVHPDILKEMQEQDANDKIPNSENKKKKKKKKKNT